MHPNKIIVGAGLALAAQWGAAQAVWRCGNSYSQQPCPGGSAVPAPEAPSAADARKAAAAARVDAQRAAALEQARLAQEKNAPKAIVIAAPQPQAKAKAAGPKAGAATRKGKPEHFTAVSPKPAKK